MKKLFSFLFLLLLSINIFSQVSFSEFFYQDPQLNGFKRLPMRSTSVSFVSEQEALTIDKLKAQNITLLNGIWKFSYAPNPQSAIKNFYKKDYNSSSWKDIEVPSNWEQIGRAHV